MATTGLLALAPRRTVQLTYTGRLAGTTNPSVKAQVKTTDDLRILEDGSASYDLDVPTYEFLRKTDHFIPRVLVVFGLSPGGERFRLEDEGTLLIGRGLWVSLEGMGPTANTSTIAVKLPLGNQVDEPGLLRMLEERGAKRSTVVPEEPVWE
jgi:hypothetical protein